MRPRQISVKNLCLFVALGALLSMLGVIVLFFVMRSEEHTSELQSPS